jgi:hypothetical protein
MQSNRDNTACHLGLLKFRINESRIKKLELYFGKVGVTTTHSVYWKLSYTAEFLWVLHAMWILWWIEKFVIDVCAERILARFCRNG